MLSSGKVRLIYGVHKLSAACLLQAAIVERSWECAAADVNRVNNTMYWNHLGMHYPFHRACWAHCAAKQSGKPRCPLAWKMLPQIKLIFSRTTTPQQKINRLSFSELLSLFWKHSMQHHCSVHGHLWYTDAKQQNLSEVSKGNLSLFQDSLFCLQLTAYTLVTWRGHFTAGLGNQELTCLQRQQSSF